VGGCTDCHAKGGCDERKHAQRAVIDGVLAAVYPGAAADRTWGRPDDEARFRAGVPRAEVRRLARSLAAVAKAPTFFRAGGEEDLCDFVWVLCVGREPSLLALRDGAAPAGDELGLVEERYLRVCFSTVARLAAMQEVTLQLEPPAGGSPSAVRESPRPGVFDPVLLRRMQKIVALLEASDIAHLDFGLLDVPLDGASPGDYRERYGAEPRLCNFLFYAAPPTTSTLTLMGASAPTRSATAR
jgi:hypothetical protein